MINREKADKAVDYLCECLCEYSKSKRECRYCKLGAVRARVEEIPYDDNPTVTHGAIKAITELKAKLEKPIQFRVIDTTTGKEPSEDVIYQLAEQGRLVYCDIDGFYIGEDGEICLIDDCGNATWLDGERFKVEVLR